MKVGMQLNFESAFNPSNFRGKNAIKIRHRHLNMTRGWIFPLDKYSCVKV